MRGVYLRKILGSQTRREVVAQMHPPQGLSNAVTMQDAHVQSNFPPTDVPSGRRCGSTKSGSWYDCTVDALRESH